MEWIGGIAKWIVLEGLGVIPHSRLSERSADIGEASKTITAIPPEMIHHWCSVLGKIGFLCVLFIVSSKTLVPLWRSLVFMENIYAVHQTVLAFEGFLLVFYTIAMVSAKPDARPVPK